jgi:hypothetical protein
MATGNPVLYTDFSGGLNLEAGPYLAEDNQCQDCRNVYANRTGALNKRNGSTRISEYEDGAGTNQIASAHSLFGTTGAATGFIGVGPRTIGQRTNLVPNPSFEVDTASWTFASSGWSAVTQARLANTFAGSDGDYALRMTATKDATGTARNLDASTSLLTGIVEGQSYTASAAVNLVAPGNIGGSVYIDWRTDAGANISYTFGTAVTVAGTTTISATGTAPLTAEKAYVVLRLHSDTTSQVVDGYFDAVLFEQASTVGIYFPTVAQLDSGEAEWTGTANDSTSTLGFTTATDSIVKITTGGVATTIRAEQTAGTRWEWVQGPLATDESPNQGPYYGMNGVDTPQYWDGTSDNTEDWVAGAGQGEVPDGTPYLIYAQDRMWATGDPDYPGRIWKTGINDDSTPLPDPCNWDTDLIDDIDPDDGQITTGLGTVGPYVIVFKERKSYVISDGASGIYRTLSSSIGCSSHRSIVETTQGTLFLSEDLGVCITDGSNIRVVSDKIKPLLATISETQPIAYKRSVGVYFQDSYWLSIPYADNKNSITLQYQLDTGAWWIHSLAAADYAIFDSGNGAKLYGAVSEIAGMDQMLVKNVYTDNGSPFQSYWEGPYWTWGAPQLNKRISQYRIDGVGYWELDAGTTFGDTRQRLDWIPWESGASTGGDFGDSGTDFGDEGTFGATPTITQKRYYTPTDGWGRAWSLKIYDDNANANTMEIYSIAGFLRPRSD